MNIWKPKASDLKSIRAYAAKSEWLKPNALIIEAAFRENTDTGQTDLNVLALGGFEQTDLSDFLPWSSFRGYPVKLTDDGKAEVDFYVKKRPGPWESEGELLTNVQAHVETIDGKPRLVRITGTGTPAQELS